MKLTKRIVNLAKKNPTPLLVVDLDIIRSNYKRIKKIVDKVEVFYAMKANDHEKIVSTLTKESASFEISSLNELKVLLKKKVPTSRIMCLNPIKSTIFVSEMYKHHIEYMAADSKDEIDKIAKYAPSSKIILRIIVSNEGSDWPLTKKFGVDANQALSLLRYAKNKKLNPAGLTFHVGSQCLNKNNWASALYMCNDLWNEARTAKINMHFLSLGGGLPIQHLKYMPPIEDIGKIINAAVKKNFKTNDNNFRITIEPGRAIVGDAGVIVSSVIGKAKRSSEEWLYIDAGVFNCFMETIEGFTYEMKVEKAYKNKKKLTIGGPSCDSVDIPFKNVNFFDLNIGEKIYFINAAAYTTVYASRFNGFDTPKVIFINE